MGTNQVPLHRVLKAAPEKVYRAFTEVNAVVAWLPPYGFLCTVQQFDVKLEGTFRMTFHNFTTNHAHSFGGKYLAVKPN